MIVFADRETHRGFLREKQQERAVKYAIPAETRRIMKISTKTIVTVGMFTAVLSVLSILTIPMPTGVPVTLQTFAMALCGYVLGWKKGTSSTLIYILLGTVGVPVFAGMTGGPSWLAGYSGGFIWGFIFLTMLCGVGMAQKQIWLRVLLGLAGLAVCHLLGVIQFAIVAATPFPAAFARRLQQEIFWKRRQKRQFRSVQLLWQTNSEDITSSVLRSMREKATAVRFVKI